MDSAGVGTARHLVAAGAVVLLGLAGLVTLISSTTLSEPLLVVAAMMFLGVGAIVMVRAGGNRVGLVLAAIGLALLIAGLSEVFESIAGGIFGMVWLGWFVLAGFLLLWFPTGAIPSPRWRPLQWLGYACATVAASYAVAGRLCVDFEGTACSRWEDNPIGIAWIPNPEFGPLSAVNLAFLATFVFGGIAALIARYRRGGRVERLQLKGLIFSVMVLVAAITAEEAGMWVALGLEWLGETLTSLALIGLPVSIGLAVLRFRLYEVERIISRTIGFGLVAVIVGMVYGLGAVWLPRALLGERSPLFVAGSTLVAAAVFNPVRRRVMAWADHRFYRSNYNVEAVVSDFSARLRDQIDAERLVDDWQTVVVETLRPAAVGIWMRDFNAG